MRCILLFTLLFSTTSAVWAWGNLGHEIVCAIAWREMSPDARHAVSKLLLQTPPGRTAPYSDFAQACTWADAIKSKPEYAALSPQHYLNVARSATVVRRSDCDAQHGCVTAAIRSYRARLAASPFPAPGAPPLEGKLLALLMLGHLVGDVHQPLHVSYAKDAGGGLYKLRYQDRSTSLHHVWDLDLIERNGANYRALAQTYAGRIPRAQRKRDASSDDPEAWATESLQLTRQIYAQLDDAQALPEDYFAQWHPVVVRRLQAAGVRLAAQLNVIFGD